MLFPASMLSRSSIGPPVKQWRFAGGSIVARFYVFTAFKLPCYLTLCIGAGVNAYFGRQ